MPKAPVLQPGVLFETQPLHPASSTWATCNPFIVNDLWLCRELGWIPELLNPYGSSLIYGHPQVPTGMRAMAESIEALTLRGGNGLFNRLRSRGQCGSGGPSCTN